MDPKSGLRPYLQRDVDDILNAIIDDKGNVESQIKIVVNGRERLVNVGLIANTAKFIWERPEPMDMQATMQEMCNVAFDNFTVPTDLVSGIGQCPRRLLKAGLTKRGNTLIGSLIYRRCIGDRLYGEELNSHFLSGELTKYQQTYLMHLLLAHGEGGHVGHGMRDWDLYANLVTGVNRFELKD